MRFKGQLKGAVTTPDGNLRAWTGLLVGVGVPLIAAQAAKSYLAAETVTATASGNTDYLTTSLPEQAAKLNWAILASPFVLALPLLIFKKTRGAALGIIGGGIAGDLIYSYWPEMKQTSTPTKTQTEGAPVQILRG